jgi:DNA-binding PadR family transcriptional regulator
MSELPRLSFTDWIVLALIAERPCHGFAIATLTAEGGDIGEIWQIPQPVVYRSLNHLAEQGLVHPVSVEDGDRGPRRTVFAASRSGAEAVAQWLAQPAAHVREVRSELLVKLALLHRRGENPLPLVDRQRAVIVPIEAALSEKAARLEDFADVVALWRLEGARAALRFLDSLGTNTLVADALARVGSGRRRYG